MPKFVLIDHSLKDIGGHHFSFDREVIGAALRAGFEPVLATHRRFRDTAAFAASCAVLPLFHHESYSPLTFDMQAYRPGVTSAGRDRGLAAAWRAYRRSRLARTFTRDCRVLFNRVPLQEGDQVFLATASEIDLSGLAAFLRSGEAARGVDWHVQFHFGIFRGRDTDYDAQADTEQALRDIFRAALAGLQGVRLHCYCTTEALTTQYRRLGVAPFHTLPYPVNSQLRAGPSATTPVRIACLGHSRREKGLTAIGGVIAQLWSPYLRDGHAQLLVQTHRRRPRRELAARVAALGAHGAATPLVFAPFPLDLDGYEALVRSTGIGLLLYDSARYYARCSGVLLELLCTGAPVIVPAGCWLSEQIAVANQSYLRGLEPTTQPIAGSPSQSGLLALGRAPTMLSWRLAEPSTFLLLRMRASPQGAPAAPTAQAAQGRYLRLELLQRDHAGTVLPAAALASQVVAVPGTEPGWCAFALDPRARDLELRIHNAWHDAPTILAELAASTSAGPRPPLAAVGLSVHEDTQAAAALAEVLEHYAHYRAGAAELARQCAAYHNADRLLAQLAITAGR